MARKHLTTLEDWTRDEILSLLDEADVIKAKPRKFRKALRRQTLLMLFEKPSLRTRVSFEVGMTQLGGHAIYYPIEGSPLGKKESIEDFARVVSRMANGVIARLYEHETIEALARHSTVPVVNALTNHTHPCQILADLMTVRERKGKLEGLTLAYVGDAFNNVTHSLLYGCSIAGMSIRVGCPEGAETSPEPAVVEKARALADGTEVEIVHDATAAVAGADIVYTDSWMSYHIPPEQEEERRRLFQPFQVNAELMAKADPDALFMNCLPAMRGAEQTAEVIDGPQSIVFDEAENRLHAQKALLLRLMGASD
jgi:ornithine carbamoyltransferase